MVSSLEDFIASIHVRMRFDGNGKKLIRLTVAICLLQIFGGQALRNIKIASPQSMG